MNCTTALYGGMDQLSAGAGAGAETEGRRRHAETETETEYGGMDQH
ncbi:hypothetical protein ACIBO2_30585 [Nonomuraea sp. NPDC050022]